MTRVKGASEFTNPCLHLALLYFIRPNRYDSCLLSLSALSNMWQTLFTLKAFQNLSSTDSGLASSWLFKEEDKRIWTTTNALKMPQIPLIPCLSRSFLVRYHYPVKISSLITSDERKRYTSCAPNEGRPVTTYIYKIIPGKMPHFYENVCAPTVLQFKK